jgi:hypothetical protein
MIAVKTKTIYESYADMVCGVFQHCMIDFADIHPNSLDEEVYKNTISDGVDEFIRDNRDILEKHKDGIFAELSGYHEHGINLVEQVDSVEELIKKVVDITANNFWHQDIISDGSQK